MNPLRNSKTLGLVLATSFTSGIFISSSQAVTFFTEDFSGNTLDPAWQENGDSGHIGLNGSGQYGISDPFGSPGTELRRPLGGTPDSFTATLDATLATFLTPNTQSDFKFRFFGPDGFVEVVTNSFGNIRVFSSHASGNVGGPEPVAGLVDSDTLNLVLNYDLATDTFDVSYGLNGGATTNLATYTGAGNFYGNITDVQIFKFGDNDGPATIELDNFNVSAPIPEPSAAVLLAACFGLTMLRRRR